MRLEEINMLQVQKETNENFNSFLTTEFASHGISNSSLKSIFSKFIGSTFQGNKFVNLLSPRDRQTLLIETIDDKLILTFKYILDNNEYLEVEIVVLDEEVRVIFAESPDFHLLYDSENPIILNRERLLKVENDYGLTLADLISILFKALLTKDVNYTIKNALNLTNTFEQLFVTTAEKQDYVENGNTGTIDRTNIWVF